MTFVHKQAPLLPVATYAALAFGWVLDQHELNRTPGAVVEVIPTPGFNEGFTLTYGIGDDYLVLGTYTGTALGGIVTLTSAKINGDWYDYNRADHFAGLDDFDIPKRIPSPEPIQPQALAA